VTGWWKQIEILQRNMADSESPRARRSAEALPLPSEVALVLQGGGALGSYQAGVFEALAERGIAIDRVAGISIGAVNAAIIAGNPPELRVHRLGQFWDTVTGGLPSFPIWHDDRMRELLHELSAGWVASAGVPGFFKPRMIPPLLAPPGSPDALSFYDSGALAETLDRLVDWDLLNNGPVHFSVGAVDVESGNFFEIPRDAETLQHRSGRTGRAGKKGTAVLIVPYPRRRRVEQMLHGARIPAVWIDAPTPEQIRAADRERLIAALLQPIETDEEDIALAERLLAEKTPAEIAAALVRAHRSQLPEPEELIEATPEARRAAQQERHRPGFDDTVWFRMDIGRRQNADPRWILPLICRRGHITRNEVGAIRIAANETHFQIPAPLAAKFSAAVDKFARTAGDDDDGIRIERATDAPQPGARADGPVRRGPPNRSNANGKPGGFRKGPPRR